MKNKKAVVGAIIINAIALLAIILILSLFIGTSFLIKQTRKTYTGVEEKSIDIDMNLGGYHLLNSLLRCEGEFNAERRYFYEVLNFWNEEDSQDMIDFVSDSGCIGFFVAVNEDIPEIFWCNYGVCGIIEGDDLVCNDEECFSIKEEREIEDVFGDYIDFQLLPYKIKLYLKSEVENEE